MLFVLRKEDGELTIEAEGYGGKIEVRSKPLAKASNLALSVIQCGKLCVELSQ